MNRGHADREAKRTPTSARGIAENLPHPFAMTWRDGLFLHWPVAPDALRPHVPDPLELDTRDGEAWVSVLPFVLARAGFRGSPPIVRVTTPELNVRTYVRYRDDPGLFFFSIDVGSATVAAVADRLTRLPVHRARMHVGGVDGQVAVSSSREPVVGTPARFAATYRPTGEVFYPEPGTLAAWLVERRRFYASSGRGVLTGEVSHAPWPLRPADATLHENTTFAAEDLPVPSGEPIAHFCGELAMTGSILRRLTAR